MADTKDPDDWSHEGGIDWTGEDNSKEPARTSAEGDELGKTTIELPKEADK